MQIENIGCLLSAQIARQLESLEVGILVNNVGESYAHPEVLNLDLSLFGHLLRYFSSCEACVYLADRACSFLVVLSPAY